MSFQDFQKTSKRLSPRDVWFLVGLAIVIVFVLALLVVFNYYLANVLPAGGELTLLRTGGDFFLFERIDPYSGSVPARVQELIYGRAALPGEDVYILNFPFHLMLIFLPLALIPDALIARMVWLMLMEITLLGSIYVGLRLIDRKTSFVIGALFFIASFTSFYAYSALLEGSPAILLVLFYLGILLSLRAGLDELAGALFLLSGFYLEVGAPFLLLVVLWVFWERRWRVFGGTAMLGVILFALAFFLYPGWLMPFLRAAWNSFRIGFGFTTREIFLQLWPDFGSTLSWVLTAVLIVTLGYEWSGTRGTNSRRFLWTAFLTLAATPLLGLPIKMDQLVILTMPLILVVVISRERWRKWGNGIALALLLLFFGLPWLLYLQGMPQGSSLSLDELLFLFWPASAVIGLYWIRWWMIRPPRTWFDTATQLER